jgi:hypothetical protein
MCRPFEPYPGFTLASWLCGRCKGTFKDKRRCRGSIFGGGNEGKRIQELDD